MSAILIVLCLIIGFFRGERLETRKFVQRGFLMVLASIVAVYIFSRSMDSIGLRVQSYITGCDVTNLGGISLVTITSFQDLYKLSLIFLFAIVMPIGYCMYQVNADYDINHNPKVKQILWRYAQIVWK